MISMPVSEIITKISQKSGLTPEEIKKQIAAKVEQLYGLVSEEGAAHIIANELGIKLFDLSGELKIKDILIGMRSVDVNGRVLRKYDIREFATEKRKGKVANLLLGDETGSMRVVFWNDKTDLFSQLKEEDTIQIKGAYVRDNMGRKELHLGDNSKVIINPAGIAVKTRDRIEYDKKHISELTDGMTGEILGTIVQVFDIKFFEVCGQCNKRLRMDSTGTFLCDDHGIQKPQYNYVTSIYVDDGTGNIRVTCWKQQTQKLLNKSDDEILGFKNIPGGFEPFKTDLLGEQIKVLGRAKNNITARLEFTADIIYRNLDPTQELKELEHAKPVTLKTNKYDEKPITNTAQTHTPAHSTTPTQTVKSNELSDDEFEISEDFLE